MKDNFKRCFQRMLKSEGGYSDNPKDPGGATNLGVTKKAWEDYVGHEVTKQVIKDLTPDVVRPFYKTRYWDACKCDGMPSGLDYCLFDMCVNAGPGRAVKLLQKCLNLVQDGQIGVKTMTAVAQYTGHPLETLIQSYTNARIAFYRSLPTFTYFGKGWVDRANKVASKALSDVAGGTPRSSEGA